MGWLPSGPVMIPRQAVRRSAPRMDPSDTKRQKKNERMRMRRANMSPGAKAREAERKRLQRAAASPSAKAKEAERKRQQRAAASPGTKAREAERRRQQRAAASPDAKAREAERRRQQRAAASPGAKAREAERRRQQRVAASPCAKPSSDNENGLAVLTHSLNTAAVDVTYTHVKLERNDVQTQCTVYVSVKTTQADIGRLTRSTRVRTKRPVKNSECQTDLELPDI
ncbi:ion-translocating oxidoreductase complex subunit C isoform X3 [Rhipicephalus sanguineus]|uniref:ion-translocating oxidoreductase complex subunit C isoform X3 n=1 Tax=Rhipicephalus sanguineus TaxID=34632 RepID=UPI0020C32551|nr:ion-translocating oxidoreductase complex subunit C isoform X3 [Rhipicephalus sanguineus]